MFISNRMIEWIIMMIRLLGYRLLSLLILLIKVVSYSVIKLVGITLR